jgi:hypothetical protein
MNKKVFHSTYRVISDNIEGLYQKYLEHKMKESKGDGSCYFWQHMRIKTRLDYFFWHSHETYRLSNRQVRYFQALWKRWCSQCGETEVYLSYDVEGWNSMSEAYIPDYNEKGNLLLDIKIYRSQKPKLIQVN